MIQCEKCKKQFLSKRQLIGHMQIHTPKRKEYVLRTKNKNIIKYYKNPFLCSNCNTIISYEKMFFRKNDKNKNKNKNKIYNFFCNRSCAATYNNTHKTKGNRRSKLEIWLEEKLKEKYKNLNILYCDKKTINSELDIYIPSLKLAFELNGIFHYEPIFGESKLEQIQNNDNRKFQACLENVIELCIIDASSLTYFKEESAKKYLDIITNIIDNKKLAHLDSNQELRHYI